MNTSRDRLSFHSTRQYRPVVEMGSCRLGDFRAWQPIFGSGIEKILKNSRSLWVGVIDPSAYRIGRHRFLFLPIAEENG